MATRILAAALAAVVLAGLVACGDSDDDAAGGAATTGTAAGTTTHEIAPLAMQPPPPLDVDALTSDTPGGVVDAQAASGTTYVGSLGDDFSVAVSLADGAGEGAPQDALVYVCDGQGGTYLTGEVGEGTTTLQRDDIAVEMTRDADAISGAVTFGDEDPRPFTAQRATGDAGLYGAEFAADGVDYRPVWVVQEDGTQRGGACWQCCSGEGCTICCPAPADVAGPTVDPEPETWWQRWFRN